MVKDKGGKKSLSEIEIMARIENLMMGLTPAGLEFISKKISERFDAITVNVEDEVVQAAAALDQIARETQKPMAGPVVR